MKRLDNGFNKADKRAQGRFRWIIIPQFSTWTDEGWIEDYGYQTDAFSTISKSVVSETNDAEVKYYDTLDRALQFRDTRGDNEQTRPSTRHQTEKKDEESTDEERLGGFNLKYISLCED